MTNNPYAQIKQNAIFTASPQELTLMLFNGAIKFGNQAVQAINENNPNVAHDKIIRVENIIQEFRVTLDHKYPVAADMDIMYEYMNRRLIEANLNKDADIVEEVIGLLREFRDTWKTVMTLAKNPQKNEIKESDLVS